MGFKKEEEKPLTRNSEALENTPAQETRVIVPIAGVIVAMLFAFLAFLPAQSLTSNAQKVLLLVVFPEDIDIKLADLYLGVFICDNHDIGSCDAELDFCYGHI